MRTVGRLPAPVLALAATVMAAWLAGCGSGTARAQSLADRAAAAGDGVLLLSFAAREGVCGDGRGNIRTGGDTYRGRSIWESDCEPGPVRVAAKVRSGRIVELDTYVGGRWAAHPDATDLGTLEPAAAARLLLDLARTDRGEPGEDAIFPATLARGVVVWPELLEIARDDRLPTDTREGATFWLGQMAGDAVAGELEELTGDERVDLEVREAAVFALSELDGDEGIEALLRIARGGDPRIREKAMFWLADSGDPRALALFEEILAGS